MSPRKKPRALDQVSTDQLEKVIRRKLEKKLREAREKESKVKPHP